MYSLLQLQIVSQDISLHYNLTNIEIWRSYLLFLELTHQE